MATHVRARRKAILVANGYRCTRKAAPLMKALALKPSGRNCSPTPRSKLRGLIFPRIFFSGVSFRRRRYHLPCHAVSRQWGPGRYPPLCCSKRRMRAWSRPPRGSLAAAREDALCSQPLDRDPPYQDLAGVDFLGGPLILRQGPPLKQDLDQRRGGQNNKTS